MKTRRPARAHYLGLGDGAACGATGSGHGHETRVTCADCLLVLAGGDHAEAIRRLVERAAAGRRSAPVSPRTFADHADLQRVDAAEHAADQLRAMLRKFDDARIGP